MGSSLSAVEFYGICFKSAIYSLFFLYGLSTILVVIAIEIMRRSQGWHNLALIMFLVNILLFSIGSFAFLCLAPRKPRYATFIFGLYLAAENFCHWIITITYIKTSIETRMLLNKDTYLKSPDEMNFVRNFRCYLTIANISASILIIAISVTNWIGLFYIHERIEFIGNMSSHVFQFLCSVAWAWTLIRLYKDIIHSEKLLPNKRIFLIHGALLTIYYLIYLIV